VYQWEDCDVGACSAILGATGQTYTLGAADVGLTIVVQETASNTTGASDPASSATTAVVEGVPVSTSSPSISGMALEGATLTESHGMWSNSPSSYVYQWEDCDVGACSAILGATGQTYTLGAADVGLTIVVRETASNAAGAGDPASSATTAVVAEGVPVSSSPPSISGTVVEGATLTESHGSWTNGPTSYRYQWEDCDGSGGDCAAISGATGQTYTLGAADVGQTIVVQETASNATGAGSPVSSAATALVAGLLAVGKPVSNVPPSIAGATVEGQTLTESHGSWSNSPTSYSHQWEDCDGSGSDCSAISGATGQTYALGAADVGQTIVVQETASNAAGAGSPVSSAATAVVAGLVAVDKPVNAQAVPVSSSPPSISGTVLEGATLTESHGTWTNSPTSYRYQWEDCAGSGGDCSAISGATGQTYTLGAADVGQTIVVQETASNAAGAGSPVSSAATAAVAGLVAVDKATPAVAPGSVSAQGSSAVVQVACSGVTGQRCAGAVVVSVWERKLGHAIVSVAGDPGAPTPGIVAVTVARASFKISARQRAAIRISLNAVGKRLLASFYKLPTVVAINGTSTPTRVVTFAYARISSPITYFYTYTEYSRYYTTSSTTISKLTIERLPADAQVAIDCEGGGCPFARRVFKPDAEKLVLANPFANSSLTPGAVVEFVITAPNSVGKVVIVTIRGGVRPTQAEDCLPPGHNQPVKCA
ncbi:MAG: hypothetical protein ACLP22_24310, partial [Solirubrobacteraceae bacterium]